MYAVFVDNHQLNVSILLNGTIYDNRDVVEDLAHFINTHNPPYIVAWIKKWPEDKAVDNSVEDGTITAELAKEG